LEDARHSSVLYICKYFVVRNKDLRTLVRHASKQDTAIIGSQFIFY
jgi:hypothetical protein